MNKLQKKMQQLENDLDQVQESLLTANNQLEEKDKALSNVSEAGQATEARRAPPSPQSLTRPDTRNPEATNDARGRA